MLGVQSIVRYNDLSFSPNDHMHLKQLKLAGFKSFVDPVVIPFSSQLVAVVGPNGCGKSNIIDAVRWVMGESSAKSLRGESMVDVIFNGSSNRKAVGQAFVELVFDNQLGRLGGSFASYQEISVKRLVSRDGESHYYLNGVRCRRKDVTDIFLGTGAGARGYSIISQGTISRLIEARPDELRAYLEEAAGVSKYKERRRETVQRMEATRDNLARVKDVCDELEKQLVRLARQAEAAKKYKQLKQEERQCRQDIYALKWHDLIAEQQHIHQHLQQLSLQLEHHHTQISTALKEATFTKAEITKVHDHLEVLQADFYQLGMDIARLEEIKQQRARDKERLSVEKQALQAEWDMLTSKCQEEKEQLAENEEVLSKAKLALEALSVQFTNEQQTYTQHQQEEAHWNQAWQALQIRILQVTKNTQASRLHLQHLQEKHQALQQTIEKNKTSTYLSQTDTLTEEICTLRLIQETLDDGYHHEAEQLEQASSKTSLLRQELLDVEKQLHQSENELRRLSLEHAALEALQNRSLYRDSDDGHSLERWKDNPRIAELIQVQQNWQTIVEWVLAERLYAIVFQSSQEYLNHLESLQTPFAMFMASSAITYEVRPYPRLLDMIQGIDLTVFAELTHIFAATDLCEAKTWLPHLLPHESIVTLDGYWLGVGWARVANQTARQKNILAQREQLNQLKQALSAQQQIVNDLQQKRTLCHERLTQHVEYQEQCKEASMASLDAKRVNMTNIERKQQELEYVQTQALQWQKEQEANQLALEKIELEIANAHTQCQALLQDKDKVEEEERQLLNSQLRRQNTSSALEERINQVRQDLHDKELNVAKLVMQVDQLTKHIHFSNHRRSQLEDKLYQISQAILDAQSNVQDTHDLDTKIKAHQRIESERVTMQASLDELQNIARLQEEIIQKNTLQANRIQADIQTKKVQDEAVNVRISGILEALNELELTPEAIQITSGMTLVEREEALSRLLDQIKRLGAINLVAIEEYEIELARQTHLHQQSADLTEALATLEAAIVKMDRETQARFKETFDEVNRLFQELFPRLFGGGRAMLELNCGNLLEAGVLVMAQPPGKRNSTIQLLSGGEKAMTAVALVFAIFKLNPSPFCMLDEVDAPLDEANVRRFCDLMREMSQCVQFLFITHNKVTMELADHLIGVTMREPGVSRVVAVDVDEALSITQ